MTTISNPVNIDAVLATSKQARVEQGEAAERKAKNKNLDVAPFKLEGEADQLYLTGAGLNFKGLDKAGATVTFQGKSGAVNGQLANRTNSFADWMRHPISVGSMLMSALGVGAFGAMLGASLGSSVLPMFFTGAAIGLAVSAAIMAGIGLLVVAQHARR